MMKLTIATVGEVLFADDVRQVAACPGTAGEITILPHHAPIITPLKKGELRITLDDGSIKLIPVPDGGMLEVGDNQATVLL